MLRGPGPTAGQGALDPRTVDVARELARLIDTARAGTPAHHVGSSSVPGLPGKNYVWLLYPSDAADE